jgi:hypothetical protein
MRISEILDIDFAPPGVGDYFDIENEDTCVEGIVVDLAEDGYVIEVAESALEYLSSIAQLEEAEYHGHAVKLGKPMQGDVKKFKVYVRNPATGKTIKVNFGDPNMRIKKSNPARRRSFRARHNCASPGPRTKAHYWSCRKW